MIRRGDSDISYIPSSAMFRYPMAVGDKYDIKYQRDNFDTSYADVREFDGTVNHDESKALSIFQTYANQGNLEAQNNLGVLYEIGLGNLLKDDDVAEKYYRRAALRGLSEAQYNLAAILAADIMAEEPYVTPLAKPERLIEGYMWLLLACEKAHPIAKSSLPRLERHLSPEQVKEAQDLAMNLLNKMPKTDRTDPWKR